MFRACGTIKLFKGVENEDEMEMVANCSDNCSRNYCFFAEKQ